MAGLSHAPLYTLMLVEAEGALILLLNTLCS